MNSSRIVVDSACILRRANVGESDKILTLLTRKLGKIRVIAKGIRKISSRRGPHLDVFNIVRVTLHQGKTIPVVIEAVSTFSGRASYTSWIRMRAAYVIVETVDKLIPDHESHEVVYVRLEEVLKNIGIGKDEDVEKIVVHFLNDLLFELGYMNKEKYFTSISTSITYIERIVERKIRSSKFFLIQ